MIFGYDLAWLVVLTAFFAGGLVMERIILNERKEKVDARSQARKRGG